MSELVAEQLERVDEIPVVFQILVKMGIAERIDRFWPAHGNWKGLSYGQLAVLFVTYIIYSLNHRLSGMESWVAKRQHLLEQLTGWTLTPKDATDDRLGILMQVLGSDPEQQVAYQVDQGKDLIQAYELPTEVARYDTTSFNVYHVSDELKADGILAFGHSKDRRPDLLQFKQGLGTLDPAGVPLLTMTLRGSAADDPEYFPAWQQMKETIGHSDFLFVGDCKMGSLETRLKIARENGFYLCPLPMTGHVPNQLERWVNNLPKTLEEIQLEGKKKDESRTVGQGFEVAKTMIGQDENGEFQWSERWLVIRSECHAKKQQAGFLKRLENAEKAVQCSTAKGKESADEWAIRLRNNIEEQGLSKFLMVEVHEKIYQEKHYSKRGRPTAKTPYYLETIVEMSCRVDRQEAAIEAHQQLMGWRIYVTNTAKTRMTLTQSVRYYRDEYMVERGFHRFKRGSLPVLPLFLRIDERIKGLVFLLFIALQALTLIEFVVRRELAKTDENLAGLVPGNPKNVQTKPTVERLLAAFKELNLFIQRRGDTIVGHLVEKLSLLQEKILSLLKIPKEIYNLSFIKTRTDNELDQVETNFDLAIAT